MIDIIKCVCPSDAQWDISIEGLRNAMNSWDKSDSYWDTANMCGSVFVIGDDDINLMTRLVKAGPAHAKFMRMLPVHITLNAPMYWWKEMDTYKVGTVRNSCSTMHKIHAKEFELDDFSTEHLIWDIVMGDDEADVETSPINTLRNTIKTLNAYREICLKTKDKRYWWQLIQLLPSSYNQRATLSLNYEVLRNIYHLRKNHKLDEWREFCKWIETLPMSELITCEAEG